MKLLEVVVVVVVPKNFWSGWVSENKRIAGVCRFEIWLMTLFVWVKCFMSYAAVEKVRMLALKREWNWVCQFLISCRGLLKMRGFWSGLWSGARITNKLVSFRYMPTLSQRWLFHPTLHTAATHPLSCSKTLLACIFILKEHFGMELVSSESGIEYKDDPHMVFVCNNFISSLSFKQLHSYGARILAPAIIKKRAKHSKVLTFSFV